MPKRDINAVLDSHSAELMAIPGVVGVAVGETEDKTPCILVLIEKESGEIDSIITYIDERAAAMNQAQQNNFQRFNVMAKYYVDPSVVKQMGFVGNLTLKARYTWEQNKADNWAINDFTPYSPSAADAGGGDITNGGRSLFLAYNNPNYTAQILALSVVAQW